MQAALVDKQRISIRYAHSDELQRPLPNTWRRLALNRSSCCVLTVLVVRVVRIGNPSPKSDEAARCPKALVVIQAAIAGWCWSYAKQTFGSRVLFGFYPISKISDSGIPCASSGVMVCEKSCVSRNSPPPSSMQRVAYSSPNSYLLTNQVKIRGVHMRRSAGRYARHRPILVLGRQFFLSDSKRLVVSDEPGAKPLGEVDCSCVDAWELDRFVRS